MTFKKERAGIIAMVLLSQMILFLFVIDAALGKEVGIGDVLSLVYREILLAVGEYPDREGLVETPRRVGAEGFDAVRVDLVRIALVLQPRAAAGP